MITPDIFLYILFFAVGITGLIFVAFFKSREHELVGYLGEKQVARELLRGLRKGDYLILNNLLFPSGVGGNTELTQIDHIVVSIYGIFCVESKTYKGRIFGAANSKYWTQVISRYKHEFYNPLRQNYAHTEAIKRVLGPERIRQSIVSLVVFPYAEKIEVTGALSVGNIAHAIEAIVRHQAPVYGVAERDDIFVWLQRMNITSRKWRKQHIQSVKALQRQTREYSEE